MLRKFMLSCPRAALLLSAAASLWGCTVGPDFRSPGPPATQRYTREALPEQTAAAAGTLGTVQRFKTGADIPGEWWTLFHSAELDRLIRRALADSPTLATAQATLRQARENLQAEAGGRLLPTVNGNAAATRTRFNTAEFGSANPTISNFTLYNVSVSVSYALDLFGGVRRDLEGLQALVDYQSFQLEGSYLALTANVITAAMTQAALRGQIQATEEILSIQEKQLGLIQAQFKLGGVARADVLTQQAQVAQTRATLPPLQKQLAQSDHLLAVLVGALPSEVSLPEFDLNGLQLPQDLPVSVPSALVRQRPDIRANEALLHQASAQVGVATAQLYPQITLSATLGTEALSPGALFKSNSSYGSIAASLLQPIFNGGQLAAKRRAAIAAYDQAAAQYRQTVLTAFQNVADALRAVQDDARALQAQVDATDAARDSLDLAEQQFKLQAVSYLTLLNAQRQYQQARISLVQAQAARLTDSVALFQALGGGWWNRPPPGEPASAPEAGTRMPREATPERDSR